VPKTDASFDPDEYAPVAERIALFFERFPNGRILTRLMSHTDTEIVFKALVFRSADDARPASSGWAAERIGDGEINSVACLENTETSAVGRALANLGLTASRLRPSREEMEKAARARSRSARQSRAGGNLQETRSSPSAPISEHGSLTSNHAHRGAARRGENAALQRAADQITDVLRLVDEAERNGMAPDRVALIRERVTARPATDAELARVERALTRWLRRNAAVTRGDLATPPPPFPEPPPF
jgi:hypothetical protein